jgi:hypothetical protein
VRAARRLAEQVVAGQLAAAGTAPAGRTVALDPPEPRG